MKMKLRILMAAAVLAVLLTGCSERTEQKAAEAGEKDVSELSIGVVMKLYDEFQNEVMKGARDAAADLGCSISCAAPDNITDAVQQVELIENYMAQDVDILLVNPNIADAVLSVLEDAVKQGIKVVLVDTNSPKFQHPVTYIGTANYESAVAGAKVFASKLPEGANVVIATGIHGDDNHEKRSRGFRDAMEAEGCHVLDLQYCDNLADLTAMQVESWIQKYGVDGIDAVMCTDDDAAMGAIQAIKQNGATDRIKVCSFNGFRVAAQQIKAGNMEMTIAQQPYKMGYDGVLCGVGAVGGRTYSSQIIMDVEIMDASNCDKYLK